MSPEEQYPSADDASGSRVLTVQSCLIEARARVAEHWSRSNYVGVNGEVCAVGAVFAVDGLVANDVDKAIGEASDRDQEDGTWFVDLSRQLSSVAIEAIRLLNEVAARRHPESAEKYHCCNWSGPLEWVNQDWTPDWRVVVNTPIRDVIKEEVLSIYDETIELA